MVLFCIAVQMNYLNKALDVFGTGTVSPVYYVLFTSLTLAASFVLYDDWHSMNWLSTLLCSLGFLTVAAGVKLLHADIEARKAAEVRSRAGSFVETIPDLTSFQSIMSTGAPVVAMRSILQLGSVVAVPEPDASKTTEQDHSCSTFWDGD